MTVYTEFDKVQENVSWWGELANPLGIHDYSLTRITPGEYDGKHRCWVCLKSIEAGEPHRLGTLRAMVNTVGPGVRTLILCTDPPEQCRTRAETRAFREAVK